MKIDSYWNLAFFAVFLLFALGMAGLGARKSPIIMGYTPPKQPPNIIVPTIPPITLPTSTIGPAPTLPPGIPTLTPTLIPTATPPPGIPTPTVAPRPISASKLSVFTLGDWSGGTSNFILNLPRGPRVIKVIDPTQSQLDQIKKYKDQYPTAVVVVRFFHTQGSLQAYQTDDPIAYANRYFNTIDGPKLNAMGTFRQYIDYVTGPNEFEDLPYPWRVAGEPDNSGQQIRSRWNGKFWLELARLYQVNYGLKVCILSSPPSNITSVELTDMNINGELRTLSTMGAAVCYHSYTTNYSQDPTDNNSALWYRKYNTYFQSQGFSMPFILGEGGYAATSANGYLSNGTTAQYQTWLQWFDTQLRNDPYVIGVTLFKISGGNWGSFDLEPIIGWMGTLL